MEQPYTVRPESDREAARRHFSLPLAQVPELTEPRRRYVHSFLRQLGFAAERLDEARLTRVFSLLARLEEYTTHRKYNGRNWEMQYAGPERIKEATEPVIDNLLMQWLSGGMVSRLADAGPRWPEGKRFALCLTHDVDRPGANVLLARMRSARQFCSAPVMERVKWCGSTLRAFGNQLLPGRRPTSRPLSQWMAEEDKHGFKSSFFFFGQPLPQPTWEDGFYRYGDRVPFDGRNMPIRQVMREIASSGWDVGLHGSSRSHLSGQLLAEERRLVQEACGREVSTTRQHYLYFDARLTPGYQAAAGLKADSTLGSNLGLAYRCATGMPFYWYDIIDDRELDILECPLIVQDVALFDASQLDADMAIRRCVHALRQAARVEGAITVLWHNNHHPSAAASVVYRVLLEEASHLGAWGCSLRQLSGWWRQRSQQLAAPFVSATSRSPSFDGRASDDSHDAAA